MLSPSPSDQQLDQTTADFAGFRATNPHVQGATRPKVIEDQSTMSSPTVLLSDIVRLLITAAKAGRGDFVNLSYSCTGKKTHYDHGMYLFGMSVSFARTLHHELATIESDMCRLMSIHRKNPSLTLWLESLLTRHAGVESGDLKVCRVYPSIGHIVNFDDATLESQLAMEGSPQQSDARYEKWHLSSVSGNPRDRSGTYILCSHNQARQFHVFAEIDMKATPADSSVDRMAHHWLTFLDATKFKTHSEGSTAPPPTQEKSLKTLFCDGSANFQLFDYNPFDHTELSVNKGRRTNRMRRNWRVAVQLLLRRTFTTTEDEACECDQRC